MTSFDLEHYRVEASQLTKAAIAFVNQNSQGPPLSGNTCVTLNFHPDALCDGESVVACLVRDGVYRSQFETATSNGSLSAQPEGRRWKWEQQMFGGVYDRASSIVRPKYGALNFKNTPVGGAPRFGSAHLRLKSHVLHKCTFTYPDSHLNPTSFATNQRMALIPLAESNALALELLDNYIEAQVHGFVEMRNDVEALALDPSYRDTSVESEARNLPFSLEWHAGYCLTPDNYGDCAAYRGKNIADFIQDVISNEQLTPAQLGRYRDGTVDGQVLKKAWHCMARFGGPREPTSRAIS